MRDQPIHIGDMFSELEIKAINAVGDGHYQRAAVFALAIVLHTCTNKIVAAIREKKTA